MSMHAVVGNGPVGRAVVRVLRAQGQDVRLVSRRPAMPDDQGVELIRADATSPAELANALHGADVVYNCANAPYHRWPQDLPAIWNGIQSAAEATGARLVIASNLYAYGRPGGAITAGDEFAPCSRKGTVRAELEKQALQAHENGTLQVAIVRASDFYGPEVRESVLGERFFGSVAAGKPAQLYGSRDAPHSYTYVEDFARTLVAVGGGQEADIWGRSWVVPNDKPRTVDELEALLRSHRPGARVQVMGGLMLRLGALFVPAAPEMIEMLYEFTEPFIADGSETTARLGVEPTALSDGLDVTLAWYTGSRDAQEATTNE